MAVSRMTERVGRVLGGRYRLVAPVGRGASAQVFMADDVVLRRRVAVKVLHEALVDDAGFLARFQAEAQRAAALSHPHVMAVHDWGRDDDDPPYLVLEYLAGGSLCALLDAGARLSPSQALAVGLETARGLDYAHRRGFVHRDVKPANLLFGDDGRLRIADFGVARALAEAAWTEPVGATLGTARYASPEQAQGRSLSGAADVYALALVLVEAVTGVVPFSTDTTLGTLMARVGEPVPVPEALGALGDPVRWAGAADPDDRPDARRLAGALLEVARGLPRPARLPLVGAVTGTGGGEAVDPTLHHDTTGGPDDDGPADPDLEVPAFVATASTPPPVSANHDGHGNGGGARTTGTAPDNRGGGTGSDDTPGLGVPAVGAPRGGDPRGGDPGLGGAAGAGADAPSGSATTRRRWPRVLVAVGLVAVLAGGAGLGIREVTATPVRPVPDVIGDDQGPAREALETAGFEVRVAHTREDGTVAGEVVGLSPGSGTELAEGRRVTMTISDGQPMVPVPPDLVGASREDAENALRFVGLTPAVATTFDEDVAPGTVIRLGDSTPGELEKGSTVRVVVSDGPEPRTIPDGLTGRSEDAVTTELARLQLVAEVTEQPSESVEAGVVIGTDPGAGAEVERDATVTVVVSSGPPPVAVPDVGDAESSAEAARILASVGLAPGQVSGPATGSPQATDPPAGTEVREGTEVDIRLG